MVNTPMWSEKETRCLYAFPKDNKVNNFQAVQWVSEFCQKYNYSIVVTSTWRLEENYAECLKIGGLRDDTLIYGRTPCVPCGCRGDEIQKYLKDHPDIKNFVIFDDENDIGDLESHLVHCDPFNGFGENEFYEAISLHNRFTNQDIVLSL